MERIKQILKQIKPNSVIVDIGSDHGYLGILALKNNQAKFIYNIEINQKPLDNTITNLTKHNLLSKTKNILNDGLKNFELDKTIDYCVICGMGGNNISKILQDILKTKNKIKNFIVIPNNNSSIVRKFIKLNNFYIEYEQIIHYKKNFYPLIKFNKKKGLKVVSEADLFFGPYNIQNKTKEFKSYKLFLKNKFDKNKNLLRSTKNKNIYNLINNEK